MFSSVAGFLLLAAVVIVSVLERKQTEIQYFDWHAALVVLGGVIGSLVLAIKGSTFMAMVNDWLKAITGRDSSKREIAHLKAELARMESAWREGRRGEVLQIAEAGSSEESRVAAEALIHHLTGQRLAERFEYLRSSCNQRYLPQVEGWDMVARLAPSFGIVGTVAGMVQLFRNMANNSGNLGGAMAMALLATLYGILLGTALGGPMSTKVNQLLNERIGMIDLLEFRVAALIEEERMKGNRSSSEATA